MMKNGFGCLLALVLTSTAVAADLAVPSQYPTIATALAAARSGDRIMVAAGTYREHDLPLVSGTALIGDLDDPTRVVIDAAGLGHGFVATSLERSTRVAGVTITRGHARGATNRDASGGGMIIFRADVQLQKVHFVNNTADASGGALRSLDSAPVLEGCVFSNNLAALGGGAIDASCESAPIFDTCVFTGNTAAWGGALCLRSTSGAELRDCEFRDNVATTAPGLGGALACDLGAAPRMTHCLFAGNAARYGGALYCATQAGPELVNSTISGNFASSRSGGLYCKGTSPVLDHCIVSFNEREAFACLSDAQPILMSCDVFGNTGGDWITLPEQSRGALSVDPAFCGAGVYTLSATSPCAPANSGVGLIGALPVGCEEAERPGSDGVPQPVAVQAYPNPFNPRTTFHYVLRSAAHVRLTVHDVRGRRVAVVVDEDRSAGTHADPWQGCDMRGRGLPSGTYIGVLDVAGKRTTIKLQLVQ